MNFKSIKDLTYDIRYGILPKLPSNIGIVYGIARSGILPASIIATAIGAKLGIAGETPSIGARSLLMQQNKSGVLLVDDSIYGGGALYRGLALMKGTPCTTCVVYASEKSKDKVDIYGMVLEGPRMFEWNFNGIKATEDYMFDMDGVICTDPAVFDDDGSSYRNEIINGVKSLYLPQVKIYGICTNRIERWRPETEAWLDRHGVSYEKLIMQPYTTAVERRKNSDPATYKAEHYFNSKATVFVESHKAQALKIAQLSMKPVLCIENMILYQY